MTNTVSVRHNFETAHRLPHLGGKCQSLHGHSWWAEITFTGTTARDGTVAEFGALKAALRGWIDLHLDHGVMLGAGDPLVPLLAENQCKVFRFGAVGATGGEQLAAALHWPTVENVATLLARIASVTVEEMPGVAVGRVDVTETHVNKASWAPA